MVTQRKAALLMFRLTLRGSDAVPKRELCCSLLLQPGPLRGKSVLVRDLFWAPSYIITH